MKYHVRLFRVIFFLYSLNAPLSVAVNDLSQAPDLLLANIYHSDIRLGNYWVSEKLDGVRAYWDGAHFISRQGNIYNAPAWFTRVLPKTALDGELWLGRGKFEQLSGIVRRQLPEGASWTNVKFMIFDLPGSTEIFDQRFKRLEKIVADIDTPHIQLVEQFKVSSHEVLIKKLDDMAMQGAEGLMLHLGSSVYKSGRSDDLLKLKKHLDAEAVVIAYIPGKGKYEGMLGSLEVEIADKKRFKIGSGFSDAERKKPPAIGSIITYKYFGLTSNGIPRFASFMRVRNSH
ncbi:MAG: DNA ligase [Gammaproteobacteria bacterium]|nr:DNA ligase [Gammaproteobacteria bacterium]